MNRKGVCCFGILFLLTAAAASGCAPEEGKEEDMGRGRLTLEVYAWSDEGANLQLLAEAYEKKHPEVDIHPNIIPIEEFSQRMLSLKNGKGQADCILAPTPSEAAIWQNKGMLKNLDGYLNGLGMEEHYDQWYEDGMEECASYMIPYRKSRWAVYYNKTLFDKMGVAYPKEGWTWEDYGRIAEELSGWIDGERVYGSLSFEPVSTWWGVPARTKGANNPFVESELQAFKESAQWIYQLTYEKGAQMPYSRQNGKGYDYDGTFLEGKVGMYFSGDSSAAVLNRLIEETGNGMKYDIAPLPHWEGEEAYVLSDSAVISMLDSSEHPDAAFGFMRFAAGEEGAVVLASNDVIPAWESQEIQDLYCDSTKVPEHIESFFAEGKISMVPTSAQCSEGMETVRDEVAMYLLQEQDLEQTFRNIEEKLDEIR